MYLLSPAVNSKRAEIMSNCYKWVSQVDTPFYGIYDSLRSAVLDTYSGYPDLRADLGKAFSTLQTSLQKVDSTGKTVDYTPLGLGNFYNNMNYRVFDFFQNTYSINLASIEIFVSTSISALSPPASALYYGLPADLSLLLEYLTMEFSAPVNDECSVKILTNFSTLYETIVNKMLAGSTAFIAAIPQIKANATALLGNANSELNTVINEIKTCNSVSTFAGKLNCANQLVSIFLTQTEEPYSNLTF